MIKATTILLVTFALLAAVQADPDSSCTPKEVCRAVVSDDVNTTSCKFTCEEGCNNSAKANEEKFKAQLRDKFERCDMPVVFSEGENGDDNPRFSCEVSEDVRDKVGEEVYTCECPEAPAPSE
ncbi:hypothetical protein BGZ68_005922 [Mortierella alpina]|nr:hypothetical protein BGZ68_005922 [Mortierella alpina]